MNDQEILKEFFTLEELDAFKRIREFQNRLGKLLEDYINTFLPIEYVKFVGRDKNRLEGVDYMVNGVKWSVKNAWNTENSAMKKAREYNNINHWFRLNKDNSTNWNNFFIPCISPSENEFIEYIGGKSSKISTLDNFFLKKT